MSERLTVFLKTVTDFADAQCSDLEYKAQSFKDENIISYRKSAEQKAEEYIAYETGRELTAVNKTISDYEAEKKSALISLRAAIGNDVFAKVREKIVFFTESDDYADFLKRSALALKDAVGENATLLLRGCDMKFASQLTELTGLDVREDCDIELGGLRAISSDETVITDDTLEFRLDAECKDFIKKSNLKIF